MRFAVDPWDPSYGMSNESEGDDPSSPVTVEFETELAVADWRAVRPSAAAELPPVAFVDGVRRVEARIWVEAPTGTSPGVCASWAAGAVCCRPGRAELVEASIEIGRTLAAPVPDADLERLVTRHGSFLPVSARGNAPEDLWLAVQQEMGRAEARATAAVRAAEPAALVVVDGPLMGRAHIGNVVGLVKTHHVRYLTGRPGEVLAGLIAGERTPVFTLTGKFPRHSWYVALPGAWDQGVPLAGVVRCEAPVQLADDELAALADSVTAGLQRFASAPHKDRRAPQNLTPIAGLERLLRHRMGDPAVLYRALRVAAAASR